jgi:hypothetical protein
MTGEMIMPEKWGKHSNGVVGIVSSKVQGVTGQRKQHELHRGDRRRRDQCSYSHH